MSPGHPRVVRTELVRVSTATSLLRVDVDNAPADVSDIALIIRNASGGSPRRIAPLPVPPGSSGGVRLAFGLPAVARLSPLALALGEVELPLAVPPERSREDAVASVALRRARERLAELEAALAERERDIGDAAASDDPDRSRLEQQLAEHRVLRAQLARELQGVRRQTEEMHSELAATLADRDRLLTELEEERATSAAERERLTERLQAAHQRVEYLQRRLVEIQAQQGAGGRS